MKAALLKNYGETISIEEVELRPPQKGEVKVKMKAAGLCRSDLHVAAADLPLPVPIVLGHEGAGVVVEVGVGVHRVKPGDHVVLSWVPECGECHFCLIGRKDLCDQAQSSALLGTLPDGTTRFYQGEQDIYQFSMTGTFSEFTVVPESGVIPIRKEIPFAQAALVGCSVMTGVGAVMNTAKVQIGSNVVVIGAGGVGLNVIQGAALAGAKKIIAVDVMPEKLEIAYQFGATHAIDAAQEEVVDTVLDMTDGLGADYAFEVIGRPETIAQAYNCVRKAGTAVVIGIAPPNAEVSLNAFSLPSQAKILTGSWYGQANPPVDIPILLDMYQAEKLKLDELVTQVFTLDQVNEGFAALKSGKLARGVIQFPD